MNDSERNVIRSNRTSLVKSIVNVQDVLDGLFERGLFTESMNEDILSQKTRTAQVRMLLDYVVRRGPNAFDGFYDALVSGGDGTAADFLRPERKSQRLQEWQTAVKNSSYIPTVVPSSTREPLPSKWPDDTLAKARDIPLELCRDHQVMGKFNTPTDVYPLKSSCRGHAVIINNEDFEPARKKGRSLQDRTGTMEDEAAIGKTFHQFGFEIILYRNLTGVEIQTKMMEQAKLDHSVADCLVVFVLSHGERDCVLGVDGEKVPLSLFLDVFDGDGAPSLVKKPKLFFIQACQGSKEDDGSVTSNPVEEMIAPLKKLSIDATDAKCERTHPSKAETFMALATTADYVSWRNMKTGTWFIQALIFVLRKYAATAHLLELMTMATRLVSQAETASGHKQVSEHRSTLTRDLYFFPGLPEPVNSQWQPEESMKQAAAVSSPEEKTLPQSASLSSMASSASSTSLTQADQQHQTKPMTCAPVEGDPQANTAAEPMDCSEPPNSGAVQGSEHDEVPIVVV